MSCIYVIFAPGFEEVEGLTVVDLLRRAELDVRITALGDEEAITGAHGIRVLADEALDDIQLEQAAAVILPGGGPGTKNLGSSPKLAEVLKELNRREVFIGAICAAPSVLGKLGLLKGRRAVCYPGFEDQLKDAEVLTAAVVRDGHVITSRGLGTAIAFGLEFIACLKGKEEADKIKTAILADDLPV